VRAYFLGLQARALAKANRLEEGLVAAAQALATVERTGEQGAAAELHRVRGELLVAAASPASASAAEESFRRALAIAQKQRLKSWELRVATTLWGAARRRSERGSARRLVTRTCDWFTEGHETADLRAARVALATS
jgi:predicted ATPase